MVPGCDRCPRRMIDVLPGLSPGSSRSRGTLPSYAKEFFASATAAVPGVPAQGLWTQVPATALEPALLPGPGMPAAAPPLAGGAAAGPTASGRGRPSRARRRGTCAPSACPRFVASGRQAEGCGGAWSRSNFFLPSPCARGRGAMNRPRSWAATRRVTVVLTVARRFSGCGSANASGFGAAPSRAAANAPSEIKPRPRGVGDGQGRPTTPPGRRRPPDRTQPPRRSAVDGPARPAG